MLVNARINPNFYSQDSVNSKSIHAQSMIYSMPHANDLKKCLQEIYPIEKIKKCFLHSRGRNDVYIIKLVNEEKYIVRLGNEGFCIASNLKYELAFIEHLRRHGAPSVKYVKTRDSKSWATLRLGGRDRSVVLFDYIKGDFVTGISSIDAYTIGRAIGKIHNVGQSYIGPISKIQIDADYLIEKPLSKILDCDIVDKKYKEFFKEFSERTNERLVKIEDRLTVGRCHGDCHNGNALVQDAEKVSREAIFFDFECAGPGWLIYDLATSFLSRKSDTWKKQHWHSFLSLRGQWKWLRQNLIRPYHVQ